MDIIIAFIICFILLISSVFTGLSVVYPLIISLLIFIIISKRMGYGFNSIFKMCFEGGKKSLVVLKIFVLIGAITSTWMASGTVSAIVYYGIKLLNPRLFILSLFLISSFVSFLIGTSFGTVGTVGIALMVMARGGGVDVSAAAGAILSGAYFGDRCSPMSSSANLVASLTDTDIYKNLRNMFKTASIPFIAASLIYYIISLNFPLNSSESSISSEIARMFNVGFIVLIPAAIIFIFSVFKIDVKLLMLISITAAALIGIFIQKVSILQMVKYIFLGYSMEHKSTLGNIIKGGGIFSMLKVSLVVFISSAFSGIFEGTGMLKHIEDRIKRPSSRSSMFFKNIIVSIASAAFGCSQALAVILTHLIIKKGYESNGISEEQLAVDMENSAIVISPLIPWNIAGLVPLVTLMAPFKALIFSFYLYLLPILCLVNLIIKDKYRK